MYRLLVCSYKPWFDQEFFAEQMKRIHALHGDIVLVHRGGSWGADLLAHDYAKQPGFSEDVFQKDIYKLGYDADRELNQRMVQSSIDEIWIFINSKKSKTRPITKVEPDICVLAELYHIPVVKFELSRRKNRTGQMKFGALGGRSSEKPAKRHTGRRYPNET
jgi:hypothetical protein